MANYSVTRAKHATLVANTADTVTLALNSGSVEVVNRASSGAGLFFTIDGTAPTVAGDDTFWVPAGESLIIATNGERVVKLISATADPYTIVGTPGVAV